MGFWERVATVLEDTMGAVREAVNGAGRRPAPVRQRDCSIFMVLGNTVVWTGVRCRNTVATLLVGSFRTKNTLCLHRGMGRSMLLLPKATLRME